MKELKPVAGIKTLPNQRKKYHPVPLFSEAKSATVRRFHATMAEYAPTPLVGLDNLAAKLGVARVFVKDESHRFGLNAFKALGGSFGMARLLADKLELDMENITDKVLASEEVKKKISQSVFISATDGNHGRGVAWCAARMGCKSVIYLPKGSAPFRVAAIEKEGALTHVTDLNYDDTVRRATQAARENNWTLMQDTSMPGYEQIPGWIMQGYTTMVAEALEQLQQTGIEKPTHVLIQAGVGSMAAAVLGFLVEKFHAAHPTTIIIEPENAACFYKSIQAGDGQPHNVGGDLKTRMAGLACGEPNPPAWEILRDYADFFVACPDFTTAEGMRRLASPFGNDSKIVSGESGAVGIGLIDLLMRKPALAEQRKTMGLDRNSVVLTFSTEGDTDPEGYRQIVERGQCPSPI